MVGRGTVGGRRRAPNLTAVMAAVLAAVALASCASNERKEEAGRPASASSQLVGYKWLLTEITTSHGVVTVPASLQATYEFTGDQHFLASDSVNAISGGFTQTQSGFTTHNPATTVVGYVGTDLVRTKVIEAIRSVTFGTVVDVSAGSTPSSVVMAASGYRLTFSKVGNATTFPPPSPTATTSR
jgi:hypothetical protein